MGYYWNITGTQKTTTQWPETSEKANELDRKENEKMNTRQNAIVLLINRFIQQTSYY